MDFHKKQWPTSGAAHPALFLVVAAFVLVALAAVPASGAPWPMHQGDAQNTGYVDGELVLPGHLAWTYSAQGDEWGQVWSDVIVSEDGVVYVATTRGRVLALSAHDGSLVWGRIYSGGNFQSGGVLTNDGGVFFATRERSAHHAAAMMYMLEQDDGELRWSKPGPRDVFAAPTYADGVLYVAAGRNVLALDPLTGEEMWRSASMGDSSYTPPAVDGERVFVGTFDGFVYALDARTGSVLWRFAAGSRVESAPTVQDGLVYFGTMRERVYALDARDGSIRWEFIIQEQTGVQHSPALAQGILFVGTVLSHQNLFALDAATGERLWSIGTEVSGPRGFFRASPVVVGEHLVLADGVGNFRVHDVHSGRMLWNHSTFVEGRSFNAFHSTPAVFGPMVFVGSRGGEVHAFRFDGDPDPPEPIVRDVRQDADAFRPLPAPARGVLEGLVRDAPALPVPALLVGLVVSAALVGSVRRRCVRVGPLQGS